MLQHRNHAAAESAGPVGLADKDGRGEPGAGIQLPSIAQRSQASAPRPAAAIPVRSPDSFSRPAGGHAGHQNLSWAAFALMSWTSIGIIFGDIATSPLYVYVSIFTDLGGPPRKADVLGAASLIFWTLTLEVLVKYIGVVLRADDQGQGGTFALYSLLCRHMRIKPHGARGPAVPRSAHKTGGSLSTRAPPDDAASSSDGESESGEHRGAHRPWWQYCAANGEAARAFFRRSRRAQRALWGVSVVATAMLIGDGVLTPAISVMSAVSGLRVAVPSLSQSVVVAVTIVVLVLVFALQQLGTGQVGRCFAPIIVLWLLANAAINVYNIARHGGAIFAALNPAHIVTLFAHHGASAWRALGSVMLCVTGAEALFADLGHFSRGSISVAFGLLAYPCLVITYLGQAAHVIAQPQDTDAFWKSLPSALLYPMLVLATLATIVASQALISGVFSIVRQAMILGAFPPVRVVHTGGADPAAATQVYVPLANTCLLLLCCAVVGGFRDTVALGKAYGLAVMTDMMTTTCLVVLVMLTVWEVSLLLLLPFAALFLAVEGAYWSANLTKVPEGGWFTLAIALVVSAIMLVWWAGSRRLGERLAALAAGAQIRMLGQPQPPPLLHHPPTAPASAAAAALTPPPPPPPPKPQPLLSRLSNWALGSVSRSHQQQQQQMVTRVSAQTAVPETDAAAAADAAAPAGDVGSSLRRRRGLPEASPFGRHWQPLPESYFQPGTMALVLPPPLNENDDGGGEREGGDEHGVTFISGVSRIASADAEAGLVGGGEAALPLIIPLTRLPGIGVYYMDEKVGAEDEAAAPLPPVLIHFLRNVQAIHAVCVFISVRRPPIPTVPRSHRLHVYHPYGATPPNFYQVIAQYGYLDIINHGPAFMSELLDAILKRIVAASEVYRVAAGISSGVDDCGGGPTTAYTYMSAPTSRGSLGHLSSYGYGEGPYGMSAGGGGEREGEGLQPSGPSLARRGQSDPSGRRTAAPLLPGVAAAAAGLEEPGMGAEKSGTGKSDGPHAPGLGSGGDDSGGLPPAPPPRSAGAEAAGAVAEPKAVVEATVAAFLEARLHGVVYYASRALVRSRSETSAWPLLHWLVYGLLYRWLAALAFVDMERWQVPQRQLVELGMAVEV